LQGVGGAERVRGEHTQGRRRELLARLHDVRGLDGLTEPEEQPRALERRQCAFSSQPVYGAPALDDFARFGELRWSAPG
jgi:hypothetical protein